MKYQSRKSTTRRFPATFSILLMKNSSQLFTEWSGNGICLPARWFVDSLLFLLREIVIESFFLLISLAYITREYIIKRRALFDDKCRFMADF